ncbi:MAG TPA: HEPN domain-containing protein [Bacilli bacterium]|mgnify:CR=1 FL=1|nr:HEPN domain-containing protein [Candidatus Cloacimonas sp.]HQP14305.1 HEPN domain-containing protein [Bacilli bacterium]
METTGFQNLSSNINTFISVLRDFPKEDSSLQENQIKLRACISLIHAEIETYFESLGLQVLESYDKNKLNKKTQKKLHYSFIVYNHKAYDGFQEDDSTRIKNAINTYKVRINQNNGIKEDDILKILMPIGFPLKDIDSTWITTLNSFGSFRGELSHKSMSQIKKLIGYNYFDENILNVIVPGIKKIDKYFSSNYRIN